MGLTTRTPGAQPATKEVKTKGHIDIPIHMVSVKVSRISVVGMAYRPTSKVPWEQHLPGGNHSHSAVAIPSATGQ